MSRYHLTCSNACGSHIKGSESSDLAPKGKDHLMEMRIVVERDSTQA